MLRCAHCATVPCQLPFRCASHSSTAAQPRLKISPLPRHNPHSSPRTAGLTFYSHQGQRVRVTLTSGAEYEGIYAHSQPDGSSFVLRMVQQRKATGDIANGTARREQSNMSFQRKDVVDGRTIGNNSNKVDGKVQNGKWETCPASPPRPADPSFQAIDPAFERIPPSPRAGPAPSVP